MLSIVYALSANGFDFWEKDEMLYPFYEDDDLDISYSDYEIFEGKEQIRIYSESFNEKREHFDKLEFYLPSYTVTRCEGFDYDQLQKIFSLVKTCQEMIECRAIKTNFVNRNAN